MGSSVVYNLPTSNNGIVYYVTAESLNLVKYSQQKIICYPDIFINLSLQYWSLV